MLGKNQVSGEITAGRDIAVRATGKLTFYGTLYNIKISNYQALKRMLSGFAIASVDLSMELFMHDFMKELVNVFMILCFLTA